MTNPQQSRERPVLCAHCLHARTWNNSGVCELCTRKEAVAAAKASEPRIIVDITLHPAEETP